MEFPCATKQVSSYVLFERDRENRNKNNCLDLPQAIGFEKKRLVVTIHSEHSRLFVPYKLFKSNLKAVLTLVSRSCSVSHRRSIVQVLQRVPS